MGQAASPLTPSDCAVDPHAPKTALPCLEVLVSCLFSSADERVSDRKSPSPEGCLDTFPFSLVLTFREKANEPLPTTAAGPRAWGRGARRPSRGLHGAWRGLGAPQALRDAALGLLPRCAPNTDVAQNGAVWRTDGAWAQGPGTPTHHALRGRTIPPSEPCGEQKGRGRARVWMTFRGHQARLARTHGLTGLRPPPGPGSAPGASVPADGVPRSAFIALRPTRVSRVGLSSFSSLTRVPARGRPPRGAGSRPAVGVCFGARVDAPAAAVGDRRDDVSVCLGVSCECACRVTRAFRLWLHRNCHTFPTA